MALNTEISLEAWAEQFRGLNLQEPETWPTAPRLTFFLVVWGVVLFLGWQFYLSDQAAALEAAQQEALTLQDQYQRKVALASHLTALKQQKQQVLARVTQLEKQLPSKTEMDALLADVNQAGIARGLQFEWFRPLAAVVRTYYVEIPVSLKIAGPYHDIAQFAADVANLSRIVILDELVLSSTKEGGVTLECRARAFRSLDEAERQAAAAREPRAKP